MKLALAFAAPRGIEAGWGNFGNEAASHAGWAYWRESGKPQLERLALE